MWNTTPIERDGEDIILITGDANEGETGWIVAEMHYPEDETLRREQEKRAMMISGTPLAYKVLQDIREDALVMMANGVENAYSIVLQAERALAYMPWLDKTYPCVKCGKDATEDYLVPEVGMVCDGCMTVADLDAWHAHNKLVNPDSYDEEICPRCGLEVQGVGIDLYEVGTVCDGCMTTDDWKVYDSSKRK